MRVKLITTGLFLGLILWIAGCSGSDSSLLGPGDVQGIGNPGTLSLLIADAPLDGIAAVNVTITRVDLLYDGVEDSIAIGDEEDPLPLTQLRDEETDEPISPDNDDVTPPESDDLYITVFTGEKEVDLLSLANKTLEELELTAIASPLPSGHYKQIRLFLKDGGTVTLDDATIVRLQVPSNVLRLRANFFVSPEEVEPILLDFDLGAKNSLRLVGNGASQRYILTPMLHVAKVKDTGSINGTLRVTGDTEGNATVTVTAPGYNRGTIIEMEGETTQSGHLRMNGLPAGSYTLNGTVEFNGLTYTFTQEVTVEAGETFELGTIDLVEAPPAE